MTQLHPDIARVLVSEEAIQTRVSELADQLSKDYAGVEHVFLVGILKGAFIFLADLARQLSASHSVDFMALSSYGNTASSTGEVRLIMDLREPILNKHVVIVEDIVDSGHTLHYLYRVLGEREPASLKTCVLVRKERENLGIPVDYLGFDIPDVWVVGYGLDFADKHRTLPYIAELKEHVYAE
ncbi:MAG TPA: hypoxanthine phosphoribosyltransferase [candidate division Zixibacteria bacterium]|nr:hypoxanthine phosphoribosyltransferase [candidate division Zixibacteria bacterium]